MCASVSLVITSEQHSIAAVYTAFAARRVLRGGGWKSPGGCQLYTVLHGDFRPEGFGTHRGSCSPYPTDAEGQLIPVRPCSLYPKVEGPRVPGRGRKQRQLVFIRTSLWWAKRSGLFIPEVTQHSVLSGPVTHTGHRVATPLEMAGRANCQARPCH